MNWYKRSEQASDDYYNVNRLYDAYYKGEGEEPDRERVVRRRDWRDEENKKREQKLFKKRRENSIKTDQAKKEIEGITEGILPGGIKRIRQLDELINRWSLP